MKQEVCNDSYSVYSAFVFQSLSSLSSTSTYTRFTLQKWAKPCWAECVGPAVQTMLAWFGPAHFSSVYDCLHCQTNTLSLSFSIVVTLSSSDLLPLACHSLISLDLSSSFVISFLSQGLCPSSEKFCTYTHGITAESENASLNLIGYILSIPCMHSLWYSHAVSRTTHCVEEEALDGCSRNH